MGGLLTVSAKTTIDLALLPTPSAGFYIQGEANFDSLGGTVASAGDFNNDGFGDVMVSAYGTDPAGRLGAGTVYVLFGGTTRANVDALGISNGFKIFGTVNDDSLGQNAISPAGDVNADGFDDIIVGLPKYNAGGIGDAGGAVVIFGRNTGDWFDLAGFASSNSNGFWIYGGAQDDMLGSRVGAAGDVNGDGADDVMVGSYRADPFSRNSAGTVYVIFGHTAAARAFETIRVASFVTGTAGFKIYGARADDICSYGGIYTAGDFNHDGFDDLLVSSIGYDGPASDRSSAGSVHVIFGHSNKTTFPDLDLGSITSAQGFRILGATASDEFGYGLGKAGDFNNDGIADIVVAAHGADPLTRDGAGTAYILFGHTTAAAFPDMDLASFTSGTTGFKIQGPAASANFGQSVSGGVDLSGDGIDDVVVGAMGAVPFARTGAGMSYVLLGRAISSFTDLDLASQVENATSYRIYGASSGVYSGTSVAALPDINGDGLGDIFVGAPASAPLGRNAAGMAYVVYGQPIIQPTMLPSSQPSRQPTRQPSRQPTTLPSAQPSSRPTRQPTAKPSAQPSCAPTRQPSAQPLSVPSTQPTSQPSALPTAQPVWSPSSVPTSMPSARPSRQPSAQPSAQPSGAPTAAPTSQPSVRPSGDPTAQPSRAPSAQPSAQPSGQPSSRPSTTPSGAPTVQPSAQPSSEPTSQPSAQPSALPSVRPSAQPTSSPSAHPSGQPSMQPQGSPSSVPSSNPSMQPSSRPSCQPFGQPSAQPSTQPSRRPTGEPTAQPSSAPTVQPTSMPSGLPSAIPTTLPSSLPSRQPSGRPSCQPSSQPSAQPSVQPTSRPTQPILRCKVAVLDVSRTGASLSVQLFGVPNGTVHVALFPTGPLSEAQLLSVATAELSASAAALVPTVVNATGLTPVTSYDVYCAAMVGSVSQSTDLVAATRTTMRTACCKTVTVIANYPATIFPANLGPKALAVAVDYKPSVWIGVSFVFLRAGVPAPSSAMRLLPEAVTFVNTTSGSEQALQVLALTSGSYSLSVTLTGLSATEFTVDIVGAPPLVVLALNATPAVPQLLQAQFSDDGTFVALRFDSATDRAGLFGTFPCRTLLQFVGSQQATCQWATDSQLRVYPAGPVLINVGGNVTLSAGKVKAQCSAAAAAVSRCTTYDAVPSALREVSAPAAPTTPLVVIVAPTTIGACSSLVWDMSGSVGAAGRQWAAPRFETSTTPTSAAAAQRLALFFARNYSLSPPTPAPPSELMGGLAYRVTVTLCNFLGACGTSTRGFTVAPTQEPVPEVVMLGQATRTYSRPSSLTVSTDAFVQLCGGAKSAAGLSYAWTLALEDRSESSDAGVVSTSQNPAVFKLAPFSLAVGASYLLTVVVRTPGSSQPSSASVRVQVLQAGLAASLSGASTRYAVVGEVLTLDASSSYDRDFPDLPLPSASTSYAWSCVTTAPVLSADCGVVLRTSLMYPAVANASCSFSSLNTTSLVSVTVSSGGRSSTTQTSIVVQQSPSSLLLIEATGSTDNVNTGKQFTLLGSLYLIGPCTAMWSVDDPTIALNAVVRTPVQQNLVPALRAAVPFNLVVQANSLPQRATLQFTMTCGSASASLTVITNGAPLPGLLSVLPSKGQELTTLFDFAASRWSDPDQPLTYQFGFQSPVSLSNLVIVSRSEQTYASTTLPAGDLSRVGAVDCVLRVFDALGAYTDAQTTVTVVPSAQSNLELLNLLRSGTGSVDSTKTVLAVASSVLNAVNCSAAPNCTSLNRNSCFRTSGQCGVCLAGFVGDAGDRNFPCILPNSTDALNLAKSCANNCTFHGSCIFVSRVTGGEISRCALSDPTCEAACSCVDQFSGEFCDIDPVTLQRRREVRSNLIDTLGNLTALEDINRESVASWSANLYSLSIRPHEVSQRDASALAAIANTTLQQALALSVDSYADMLGVLQATDAVASLLRYNYNPNDYREPDFNVSRSYVNNTAARFVPVVNTFADLVEGAMVLGENGTSLLYENFRLSVSLSSASGVETVRALPLTTLELLQGIDASSVQLRSNSSVSTPSVSLKLISAYPRSYAMDTSDYISTPIVLQVRAADGEALSPADYLTEIEFTFQHNELQPQYDRYVPHNFTSTCTARDDTEIAAHRCPDSGHIISHNCSRGAGVLVSFCPKPEAACARIELSTADITIPSVCRVASANAAQTVCSCSINPARRRRLAAPASTEQILDESGSTDMMASTVYIASDFADTFQSARDFTSSGGAAAVYVVIVLLGALWVPGVLVVGAEWATPAAAHKQGKKNVKNTDRLRNTLAYIESVIPRVFDSTAPPWQRLCAELLDHHTITQIFMEQNCKSRRMAIGNILTGLTFALFLTAVFFDVSGPTDDGSCVEHTTVESCLHRGSPFDQNQRYCSWVQARDRAPYHCEYADAPMTTRSLFYMTVLTTILSSIASIPVDYLFSTLKAPTAQSLQGSKVSLALAAMAAGTRRISDVGAAAIRVTRRITRVAPLPSAPAQKSSVFAKLRTLQSERVLANRDIPADLEEASELARESIIELEAQVSALQVQTQSASREMRSRSARLSMAARTRNSAKIDVDAVRPAELVSAEVDASETETAALLFDVVQQRLLMNDAAAATNEYDNQWGIKARFPDGDSEAAYLVDPAAQQCIADAVAFSTEKAAALKAELSNYSVQHAGLEILHLFMLDLLGRDTVAAKVFQEKFGEEFSHARVVVRAQKYAAGAILLGLNAFFIYYILLKGFQEGLKWQYQYLFCCLVQLAVDLLLFETVECVWLNFSVPQFVHQEVVAAAGKLIALTQLVAGQHSDLETAGASATNKFFLNAPAHLFVSVKLAKALPQLLESLIVGSYSHHLPGEIRRTWPHCRDYTEAADTPREGWLPFPRWALRGMSASLLAFIAVPFAYQKVVLRLAQPVFYSGVGIVFYNIVHSTPALVVLSVALAAALAYWGNSLLGVRRHTVSVVAPAPASAETLVPTFLEDDAGTCSDLSNVQESGQAGAREGDAGEQGSATDSQQGSISDSASDTNDSHYSFEGPEPTAETAKPVPVSAFRVQKVRLDQGEDAGDGPSEYVREGDMVGVETSAERTTTRENETSDRVEYSF